MLTLLTAVKHCKVVILSAIATVIEQYAQIECHVWSCRMIQELFKRYLRRVWGLVGWESSLRSVGTQQRRKRTVRI